MSKTNYEVLQENRAAVLQFADGIQDPGIIAGGAVVELSQAIQSKTSAAQSLVANGDLTAAIQMLDEIKDNKIGIVWHESADLGNGTKALVRDARNVTTDPKLLKQEAGEKYAMQLLNEVRGGLDLVDKSDLSPEAKVQAKEKLMYIAQNGMADIGQLNDKSIKVFNTQMVLALETAGITEVPDKLNFAKEVSNFKDEHRHIVTLTSAEDREGNRHTVAEAEIMLNGLTDKQKQEYTVIANAPEGRKSGVPWFDNMPQYKQDLLRDSALDIASGNKIIPTQLLGSAVGIRNAYQKVTTIKAPGEESSKILSQTLHCGAPATKIKVVDKEQRQAIATENIRQLQSFAAPGENINLNILNSKTPANARGENFIFDQLKQAKQEVEGVSSTASPINRWRLLGGGRDTNQFKETLGNIADGLDEREDSQNVVKYLKNGKSRFGNLLETVTFGVYKTTETKAKAEIAQLEQSNPDLARDLGVAMECRNLADSTTLGSSSENINLELTAKMNLVANSAKLEGGALNKELPQKNIDAIPENVDFCKSGKDRTGYAQTKNTQLSVATHLGIDMQSELGQKNLVSQVAGNHTQEMAGVQGGTVGCHSIKTNPEFGLNKQDKAMNGVINQKSSHFNSSVKTKKEGKLKGFVNAVKRVFVRVPTPKEKIADKFETSFATAQSEKASNQIVEQSQSRPRSKSVSVAPPSKSTAKAQATKMRRGLESSRGAARGRSSSLPPKPKGQNTGAER